jgi:AcrR family transcriptional regulator
MTDKIAAKKRRLPSAERRQKIIDAARSVFVTQSYSGARTKQIAELAGVTEAFLYRHFESKEAMYEAAILEPLRVGISQLADDIEGLGQSTQDPVEFVREFHRRSLVFYQEFAELFSVALYSELDRGRDFYTYGLLPALNRIGDTLAESTGWSSKGVDSKVVRRAALGADWAIGLDSLLRTRGIDIDDASQKLAIMFTSGIREKALSSKKS